MKEEMFSFRPCSGTKMDSHCVKMIMIEGHWNISYNYIYTRICSLTTLKITFKLELLCNCSIVTLSCSNVGSIGEVVQQIHTKSVNTHHLVISLESRQQMFHNPLY